MREEQTISILDYDLSACPKCGKAHQFKLKVLPRPEARENVPLFGGPGTSGGKCEFLFTCPETKQKFTHLVPDYSSGELLGIATESDMAAAMKAQASPPGNSEFQEWVVKSRERALDFCKTMLSSSTGAIPLYFAVLKYVGLEKIGSSTSTKFAILPPVLYLAAAALYVLALRPKYELIAQDDFNAFRKKRLEQINQYIVGGTSLFICATGIAIVILFFALGA